MYFFVQRAYTHHSCSLTRKAKCSVSLSKVMTVSCSPKLYHIIVLVLEEINTVYRKGTFTP